MNPQRQRAIMAQQKIKGQNTLQPLPENFTVGKLTAEERKAIYAPKAATTAPPHLQGNEWVNAWKVVSRVSYGLTGFVGLILGGLVVGETRKSLKQ